MFGRSAPPPNSIVLPEALATRLKRDGGELETEAITALSAYLEAVDNPKPSVEEGIPFWLQRETANSEIEDELRERVTQRNAEHSEGSDLKGKAVSPGKQQSADKPGNS
jgi:hypothetical protein